VTVTRLKKSLKTGISGLQVQTVRRGNNEVIKCDENIVKDKETHLLAWYKQSFGNVPQPVLRQFGDGEKLRYQSGFKDGRFTVDEETFDLSIKGIKQEDAGTYFCGKVKPNAVEFGSGTRLFFQGKQLFLTLYINTCASNNHPSHIDQAEDSEVLNYAALKFAKKPPTSRPPRVKENPILYSQVKHR
uniref:Ig-like domain-containing protein n=1 Tax=Pygocentrus nattereri TaxID=42514 RepID=A0A3B4EEP2_PYGNA